MFCFTTISTGYLIDRNDFIHFWWAIEAYNETHNEDKFDNILIKCSQCTSLICAKCINKLNEPADYNISKKCVCGLTWDSD